MEEVKVLILQGIPQREIAEKLDVSQRTVERDVKTIKRRILDEIRENPIDNIIGDFVLTQKSIQSETWEIYRTAQDNRLKLNALRLLQSLSIDNMRILQTIGLVSLESIKEAEDQKVFDEAYKEVSRVMRGEKIPNPKPVVNVLQTLKAITKYENEERMKKMGELKKRDSETIT